mmetsp:Transcript_28392/g.61413  ORF Transcript_28392/g.61413 Transcript_28392/m.61413 type:complete len:107 (-) Transcript_28392:170-490(-)
MAGILATQKPLPVHKGLEKAFSGGTNLGDLKKTARVRPSEARDNGSAFRQTREFGFSQRDKDLVDMKVFGSTSRICRIHVPTGTRFAALALPSLRGMTKPARRVLA